MKTAEEWDKLYRQMLLIPNNGLVMQANRMELFKSIQLDAFKAGMTKAARLIVPDGNPDVAAMRILDFRDNLKELP